MIQNFILLIIFFFENIISGIQTFYSFLHLTVDVIRKSQRQQKLTKKITHFTRQFRSKNFTQFTNLNSLDVENNMLPQRRKNLSHFANFSANMFLFVVRKIICITPFLDVQEVHFWSTGEMGGRGRLNNFPKGACYLDLVTIFQHLNFPSIALKP